MSRERKAIPTTTCRASWSNSFTGSYSLTDHDTSTAFDSSTEISTAIVVSASVTTTFTNLESSFESTYETATSTETGDEITGDSTVTETTDSQDTATTFEDNQSAHSIGTESSSGHDVSSESDNSITGVYSLTDLTTSTVHDTSTAISTAIVISSTITTTFTNLETSFETAFETSTSTETGDGNYRRRHGYGRQTTVSQRQQASKRTSPCTFRALKRAQDTMSRCKRAIRSPDFTMTTTWRRAR